MDYFITKILIKELFDIKNFEILLDKEKRQHLIITGKNGSGKTTLLRNMNEIFEKLINEVCNSEKTLSGKIIMINHSKIRRNNFHENIKISFNNNKEVYQKIFTREFILAFFEAKRESNPIVSDSVKNIKLAKNFTTNTKELNKKFIEYMVKLRFDMLDAKEAGEEEEVKKIKAWFNRFENTLKELYEREDLKLVYDRKNLNFKIEYQNMSFTLDKLSDGYSSLIAIIAELILRMEAFNFGKYDMQGVVLIDEVETHLHITLQKKVLPFLTSFFPNIQFIVTTHSPFVLSSLQNAVIIDLEYKTIYNDLSKYSYDALVESYFDTDKYSNFLKNRIREIDKIVESSNNILTLRDIKEEIESYPKFLAKELEAKIDEIKLKLLQKGY